MMRCRRGPFGACRYIINGGYCNLPEDSLCPFREKEITATSVINPEEINPRSIIIDNCDEIILTKDSIGLKADIRITDFDQFEFIEINGKKFKRVRD